MNTVKKTIVEPAKSTDSPEHAASAARCVCSCAHSATLPAVALLEIMRGRRGGSCNAPPTAHHHVTSPCHSNASAPVSRRGVAVDASARTLTTSADGCADRIVTCGGTKPGGSQPRMTGRR